MALRTLYQAESWDRVYDAFSNVNFTSFDFETIKQSLIDYIKLYYPETFKDFIESSEFIAFLEMFAYTAEQLSYRLDMLSHENFIATAQRKQSILKLAKLINYKPARNIPARGLVKVTSIVTTERVIDSRGVNLAKTVINWNDPNNTNWKEQFFLVMNRVLTSKFGQAPTKVRQLGDVVMELYAFNNTLTAFRNGVYPFTIDTGIENFAAEIVPADLDDNGPFERSPDNQSQMNLIYATDGVGDGSDYTGFLLFLKQGSLVKLEHNLATQVPNRTLEINYNNINQTDVWVNKVSLDNSGNRTLDQRWTEVQGVNEENLSFNSLQTRSKFEVETLENDRIKLIFGDGDFADIPVGDFDIWVRQSINKTVVILPNRLQNQPMSFGYQSAGGTNETVTLTFSLTSTIQNGSASETIEHIRQVAPATYYSQSRMVNAQDYNTFMLRDQSILRLMAINRTFAGQPKYIDWNDASGTYENVKLFGDDLELTYDLKVVTQTSAVSSRSLIDEVLEPLLKTTGLMNLMTQQLVRQHPGVIARPRRTFLQDATAVTYHAGFPFPDQQEKTRIQGALDRHWYGEPLSFKNIGGVTFAVVPDPTVDASKTDRIWANNVPRTYDGVYPITAREVGSGFQPLAPEKFFGLAFNPTRPCFGAFAITLTNSLPLTRAQAKLVEDVVETFTVEVAADGATLFVTSDKRGSQPNGRIDVSYTTANLGTEVPVEFDITESTVQQGDAIIIKLTHQFAANSATSTITDTQVSGAINLLGYWSVIPAITYTQHNLNPLSLGYDAYNLPASWLILVKPITVSGSADPVGFEVTYRELHLLAKSANTKFWFNDNEVLVDGVTKNRVFDLIRILRSNLGANGLPLGHNENYDVVGPVKNQDGELDFGALEVMPTDYLNIVSSGDGIPDQALQFEQFAGDNYKFFHVATNLQVEPTNPPVVDVNTLIMQVQLGTDLVTFYPGSFFDTTQAYTRKLYVDKLDFMWQHYASHSNLIDPSVSNIHDVFLLTQGYYNNLTAYVQGSQTIVPDLPTPLDLRTTYGYLLNHKMLSDTVVLHPGKIKLLFGALADPELRASFKVVKLASASMSDEQIKAEVLGVINTFFDIANWDFGDTFYATELIALIHQRLSTQIASVVLVPLYAVNSFGSLFTIKSGLDEIVQSAAKLADITIVSELTPTVLRQGQLT